MTNSELESQWPGIKFAYDFVLPSYQWMLARFETANSRIQNLQTLVASITFGFIAVIASATPNKDDLRFISLSFIAAMMCALLAIIIGAYGRGMGSIALVNPSKLYAKFLHRPEWEFKKDMVYVAGEDFSHNYDMLLKKAWITRAMTALFILEMVFLLVWVVFVRA